MFAGSVPTAHSRSSRRSCALSLASKWRKRHLATALNLERFSNISELVVTRRAYMKVHARSVVGKHLPKNRASFQHLKRGPPPRYNMDTDSRTMLGNILDALQNMTNIGTSYLPRLFSVALARASCRPSQAHLKARRVMSDFLTAFIKPHLAACYFGHSKTHRKH